MWREKNTQIIKTHVCNNPCITLNLDDDREYINID